MNEPSGPLRNEQAESHFLGCMLARPELVPVYAQHVTRQHFYRESFRCIWGAIEYGIRHQKPTDVLSVIDYLNARKGPMGQTYLETAGGHAVVHKLMHQVVSAENEARQAFEKLDEYRNRRTLQRVAADMRMQVEEGQPAERVLTSVTSQLHDMAQGRTNEDEEASGKAAVKSITASLERRMAGGTGDGLLTGIVPVDLLLDGGPAPGVNTVVAALSGHGKTTITSAMVAGLLSNHDDLVVDWFSCEVPAEYQCTRIASSAHGVPEGFWRNPVKYGETDHRMSVRALGWLNELDDRLRVYRMGTIDMRKVALKAAARRVGHSGPYVVVVDYLQRAAYGSGESKSDRIADASACLAGIALDHDAICLGLSQFTLEAREEPIPMPAPSNARWSKDLENDAADFLIYHRPQKTNSAFERRCILQLAKSRYGQLGHVEMHGNDANQFRWWDGLKQDVAGLHTREYER